MGLFKTKSEKALKKLKKLKEQYLKLDKKLQEGNINKKEYDDYINLKEEINTMAKKFIMKDGKLVLNEEKDNNNKEEQIKQEVKEEKKEKEQLESEREKMLEQEMKKQQEDLLKQQMAQSRQPTQEEIQQYMAMKQEQERKQQEAQAQAQAQQGPTQEEIDRYNRYKEELARRKQEQQLQQAQQPKENDEYLEIILNITDMPEITGLIKLSMIPDFEKTILEAINEKKVFRFGDYMIHGKYIIAYRFSKLDDEQKKEYWGK